MSSKKRAKTATAAVKPQLRLDLASVPPPEEFDTENLGHNLPLGDLTSLHHSPIHTCGRKMPVSPKHHSEDQLQRDRLELLGPGQ